MDGENVGFDLGRAPDLSMALGIASIAVYLMGCLMGCFLGMLGLGPVACAVWTIGVVVGIVAIAMGRTGLARIELGTLSEALRGRATSGLYCGIAGVVLPTLSILALLLLAVFGVGAAFLIPILDSL